MDPADVALVAGLVLAFGLVSRRLEGSVVTPPMAFVAFGVVLGTSGLGWMHLRLDEGVLEVLAELTLALVLFADATRIDLSTLRREAGLPARLLGVGLPLSIGVGALAGVVLLPELGFWEAATLAAVLAPTDAALGQAVVSSPKVPIRIRQALNVESGLNDGIALPFVLLFASLASVAGGAHEKTPVEWAEYAALQVTLGPLVGGGLAWLSGLGIARASADRAVATSFERLFGLVVALACFAGAELVGGNGFIAAFVGGVTLGATQRAHCEAMLDFLEAEGQLLMLLVFLGLGASLAIPAIRMAGPLMLIYVALSLSVVRMLPTSMSLLGSGLRPASHLFLGWFGPRGLASVLYAVLLLSEASLPHEELVFAIIVLTVLASTGVHGLSAAPAARAFGRITANEKSNPAEHAPVTPHPTRHREPR